MSASPRRDSYDVVVVGGGFGGVSAAALIAREGRSVLLVERQEGLGGYAHSFRRGERIFDPSVHMSSQANEGELVDDLLKYLGVRERCTFLPLDPIYAGIFPEQAVFAPRGREPYIEHHARLFPRHAAEIRAFQDLMRQVHLEMHQLGMRISLKELDTAVERFPTLFSHMRATLDEVLREYVSDPSVRAVLAALWPYLGFPPGRLPFLVFASLINSLVDSAYYCAGGFQQLADAFGAAVSAHGGDLLFGRTVTRILVEEGQVTGVVLDGDEQVRTRAVVSNGDATRTFEELVGAEHLPEAFMRRFRRLTPSNSAFVVFAATSLDLREFETAHEMFYFRHWDHEATFEDILRGIPGGIWINVPTIVDPSLAPAGEHIVIVTCFARYDIGRPWSELKPVFTDELLGVAEDVFPGIRSRLTFVESATPLTLERFTANREGAAFGWGTGFAQVGSKRPGHETPITGLFLSGHWTQPGVGSLRVIASGVHTAQMLLADPRLGVPTRAFDHPDLPPPVM